MPIKLLDSRGNPLAPSRNGAAHSRNGAPQVRARYDAAVYDSESQVHWSNADGFSARAANSLEVRRTIRNRARYERSSNSYLDGITLSLSNDTIGSGPRIQVTTDDEVDNRDIAKAFEEWGEAINLSQKLHVMKQARTIDGEAFALLIDNPKLPTPVTLDLDVIECDQISTPFPFPLDPLAVDGLRFDVYGNVTEYNLLKSHPGDFIYWGFPMAFDTLPASSVIHWFQPKRPKQYRGVSEVVAALPLFAQLRRYTLACLACCETAADFAGVIQSEIPPDPDDFAVGDPFEKLEITKRMLVTLPSGYKLGQLRAENPPATYEMFKREVLNEIARCLNIPFNIAAGNSSSYNYSSGRLDHQTYYKSVAIDQYNIEIRILNRIFDLWVAEARRTMSVIPPELEKIPHQWYWDSVGSIDPVKDATADEMSLKSNTKTLAQICAENGLDWRAVLTQRAEEIKLMKELGLPIEPPKAPAEPGPPTAPPAAPGSPPGPGPAPPEE